MNVERELSFQNEKQRCANVLERRLKNKESKHFQLTQEYLKSLNWEELYHKSQLLKAHYSLLRKGLKKVEVADWQQENQARIIELDPKLSPESQLKAFFKKSKKLKFASEYLPELIDATEETILQLKQALKNLVEIEEPDQLELFAEQYQLQKPLKTQEKCLPEKTLPYKLFKSKSGMIIWVGKSSKKNDEMTFKLAHGSDWWFHVSGFAGSHVVLRVNKQATPDEASIDDAVQLAIIYSKAKAQGLVEVCITQRKYVTKCGSQPGKVQYSKHSRVTAKYDSEHEKEIRRQSILNNSLFF